MTTASSMWTLKLGDDQRVSIDVFTSYEGNEGITDVEIIGDDWVEKRSGRVSIERSTRYEFGRVGDRQFDDVIKRVGISSPNGDVYGAGKSVKAAAKDYGSKVAHLIVEQRRRAKAFPIATELLQKEAQTLRGYPAQDWRSARLAAVKAELAALRATS